ncbi:hypothetical protein [Mycobacterium sp.]|uniref:hypothetical protein n=1 Tax=Mycobacterium sp. TaxID=1785 RepID=UPI003F9C73C7
MAYNRRGRSGGRGITNLLGDFTDDLKDYVDDELDRDDDWDYDRGYRGRGYRDRGYDRDYRGRRDERETEDDLISLRSAVKELTEKVNHLAESKSK